MLTNLIDFFKRNYFLGLIVIFAFAIRLIKLAEIPPSLNWDEVSHGYNAYSLLKTGKDEWGEFVPVIFRAYGDYKLPVYIYFTAISELFFGLSSLAVRLPSVLAGGGVVIFTYLLFLELSKVKNTKYRSNGFDLRIAALFSAFLVSIEPWTFFLSRGAFEANLALFFFVAGMYIFLRFSNSATVNTRLLIISTTLFGLTLWTYNSYRIFTPLMIIVLIFTYWREIQFLYTKSRKVVFCCLLLIAFFLLPMLYQIATGVGQARYGEVKILDQGTIARIEENRNLGGSRLIHNKYIYFAKGFAANYVSHFSPSFLAFSGGSHYQFSLPGRGLINPLNYLFILASLVFLLVTKSLNTKVKLIFLFWFLLAPIPSSITREAPHVLRTVTLLPIPMILAAFGIFFTISKLNLNLRKIFIFVYCSLLIVYFANYWTEYTKSYPAKFSQAWQYGYYETIEFLRANYENYDKIVVTKKYGEPHEFLLFYWPWSPNDFQAEDNLNRFYQSNWYWVDGFDKFYFVNDWEISTNNDSTIAKTSIEKDKFALESGGEVNCYAQESRCILATSPGNYPEGWKKLKTVNFLDGSVAFEIYEN